MGNTETLLANRGTSNNENDTQEFCDLRDSSHVLLCGGGFNKCRREEGNWQESRRQADGHSRDGCCRRQFKTLITAVKAAGLEETLKGKGSFTVFAPTDDAFGKLPAGTVEALLQDPATLSNILLYHVTPGVVKAADVVKLTEATMANGSKVSISVVNGGVKINNANVLFVDIAARNGVLHIIDGVLIP